MVLLAGPGPEGGGARRVSPQPSLPRDTQASEDPADYEEYEDFSHLPDARSIASDDSFYPLGGEEEHGAGSAESVPEGVPEAVTLLRAACANDVGLLRALVRQGPRVEEVRETDRNGRVSWPPRRVRVPSVLPTVPRAALAAMNLSRSRGDFAAAKSAFSSPPGGAARVERWLARSSRTRVGGEFALPEVTTPRRNHPVPLPLGVSRPPGPPVPERRLGSLSPGLSDWAPRTRTLPCLQGTPTAPGPVVTSVPCNPRASSLPLLGADRLLPATAFRSPFAFLPPLPPPRCGRGLARLPAGVASDSAACTVTAVSRCHAGSAAAGQVRASEERASTGWGRRPGTHES